MTMNDRTCRRHVAVAHAAIILWQAYIAVVAFRSGDDLAKLLAGLGAEVGPGVALFLMTHRWWIVVPAAFTVVAIIAVRQLDRRPMFSVAVLVSEVVIALAMNIYWREAWFTPIFSLIKQIG